MLGGPTPTITVAMHISTRGNMIGRADKTRPVVLGNLLKGWGTDSTNSDI